MFSRGDRVLYGARGVCDIVDIEVKPVGAVQTEYYVLKPVGQPDAKYYVPTQNPAAVAKLRPILSQQELESLLRGTDTDQAWIEDENQRKLRYRQLLDCGDRAALVSMVHSLYKHKDAQLAAGRKFHLCDENFLKDAQKLLDSEFSLVLNIEQDEVRQYVRDAIGAR